MGLHRVFVNSPMRENDTIQLPADASHYVVNVLRLKMGDALSVFNGEGGEYSAEIVNISKKQTQILLRQFLAIEAESNFRIELVQGVSKGERMDWVVQKAVELGAHRITPVLTEHSTVRLDAERAQKKVEHWQAVARSACEQCRRNQVPQISQIELFDKWLANRSSEVFGLLMDPYAESSLRQINLANSNLALLAGPEGGLSKGEVERARRAGFLAVRFGPRVLRTETAAVAGLAALQTLFGDMG